MEGQHSQGPAFTQTNVPDYQKMLQTSGPQETGDAAQTNWQEEVETLTPSPVIQHPHSSPSASRRLQPLTRESWDGGGGGYQPSKYGLVLEDVYSRDAYNYQPQQVASSPYIAGGAYLYPAGSSLTGQPSPNSSPAMVRRMLNRAPVEHRRSFPDSTRTQQLIEDYYDGYGSAASTAGGSTSGYGSGGGGYDHHNNMRSPPLRQSKEFPEGLGTPKPRSILRNSHSQGQLVRHREAGGTSGGYPQPPHTAPHPPPALKKSVGDLRQWQQHHQEELLHQHIETQALYEKPMPPLETLVRQLGVKDEDPSRWEPVRRAADNIIREKNMIIEKLRQRVLELEEDLKMSDNKLRHALLTTDDKATLVQQKVKELQFKNSQLKTELSETRTKKNAEINSMEEQLGAAEHEIQQLKSQLKVKGADFEGLERKLEQKEREVEEWGCRFQEMKTNHHQLRQKLDSVDRYLADLPTAEETLHNAHEILRLKEEHTQNKARADDLEHKLSTTRKQLSARDMRLKEAEKENASLEERLQGLESELERVRGEDVSARTLLRCQHELEATRRDKERLSIDLEKAKKLLETTHRRLRQTEARFQTEMSQARERLEKEEEAVGALREEVVSREQQVDKAKRHIKELGSRNQDLMEQNLVLREQMSHLDPQGSDDRGPLQRRFMADLGLCFSELQSLVSVCLQRARGEEPNMSVLLGVKDAGGDCDACEGAEGGRDKGQTLRQWISKLADLRQEVEALRSSLCNQYAEDMGQNIQCATQ